MQITNIFFITDLTTYYYKRKTWKGEMIKFFKKNGRVGHLPDSHLETPLRWREPGEKIKHRAFSQHFGFHQL